MLIKRFKKHKYSVKYIGLTYILNRKKFKAIGLSKLDILTQKLQVKCKNITNLYNFMFLLQVCIEVIVHISCNLIYTALKNIIHYLRNVYILLMFSDHKYCLKPNNCFYKYDFCFQNCQYIKYLSKYIHYQIVITQFNF